MGKKQALINNLSPLLKEKRYKKIKQTWYKQDSDLIIVFNIQNSYYDKDEYYINLGIIIKKLMCQHDGICLSNCHIRERIPKTNEKGEFLSPEILVRILDLWEREYGNLTNLRRKAIEGKLPIYSTGEVITFLTTVRLG